MPSKLSAAEIRSQLDRILSSDLFRRSKRLSAFLRYVVDHSLRDRQNHLKEYSIGVDVFEKPESFDPRVDPIVRVEAGRLRAKIREYYESEGVEDPLWIGLPKRGYLPEFKRRKKAPQGESSSKQASKAAGEESGIDAPVQAEQQQQQENEPGRYRSIGVLPFADLSPQSTQEYFCDALTQQIINSLAKLNELRVVGRTSTFQFKDKAEDIRTIGKKLKVDCILEGSVQKVDKRVRVSVQLISAGNGLDLWGETYDRPLEDVFALQDEITAAIVTALRRTLGFEAPPESKTLHSPSRKKTTLEAYNQSLKGIYHWSKHTEKEIRTSIECFEEAIREDPQYAPAYAGLAACYVSVGLSAVTPPGEVMPRAEDLARKALSLDNELAKAHASLGLVNALYKWDWSEARQSFERALNLNPYFSTAYHWLAIGYLTPLSRLKEALDTMQRARDLNPASVLMNVHLGLTHYWKREYERAIAHFRLAIEMEPEFYQAHWGLGRALMGNCMLPEAMEAFNEVRRLTRGKFRMGALGHCYGASEDQAQAGRVLREMQELAEKQYVPPYEMAEIYLGLADYDAMFEWLEKARNDHSPCLPWIAVEPVFDGVRSDPRFQQLLLELGLKQDAAPEPVTLAAP